MSTYKAVMRLALEYASSIWSLLASSTSINKQQVQPYRKMDYKPIIYISHVECSIENCHRMHTNIQHLHDKTLILHIHEQQQLHTSQFKQKTQHPSHPLHKHTKYFNTPRIKNTIFNNGHYTTNIPPDPHSHYNRHKTNMHHIHTSLPLGI